MYFVRTVHHADHLIMMRIQEPPRIPDVDRKSIHRHLYLLFFFLSGGADPPRIVTRTHQ